MTVCCDHTRLSTESTKQNCHGPYYTLRLVLCVYLYCNKLTLCKCCNIKYKLEYPSLGDGPSHCLLYKEDCNPPTVLCALAHSVALLLFDCVWQAVFLSSSQAVLHMEDQARPFVLPHHEYPKMKGHCDVSLKIQICFLMKARYFCHQQAVVMNKNIQKE